MAKNTENASHGLTGPNNDVFVTFAIDEGKGFLYALGTNCESFVLKKGDPEWKPLEGKVSKEA